MKKPTNNQRSGMKKGMLLISFVIIALGIQAGTVKQNGFSLKVKSKSWGKTNGDYNEAPHGEKFVFIEVELFNDRSESIHCNSARFQLVDRKGYTYDFTIADKNALRVVDLGKGQKTKGRIAFQVPYNATPRTLIFKINYEETISIKL